MKYHELKTTKPKQAKRVGRGISAGQGKTAGRGTKGQGARTGYSKKPGFAGRSNPLMQKLPKLPGFRSHRAKPATVYTGQLEKFANKTVDAQALAEAGLIRDPYQQVKLVVKGELKAKVAVRLTAASENAIAVVQTAGGSFEKVARLSREAKKPKVDKKNK